MNGDAVGGDARSGDVTSGDVTSGVELVVVAPDGATLEVLTLPHGADPEARLAAAGWYLVALLDAVCTCTSCPAAASWWARSLTCDSIPPTRGG